MTELRSMIFQAFRDSAEDVRGAAAGVDEGLVRAVHDYRKALRRARAILRMVGGELSKDDRREIHRALTDARRSLGATRDHTIANDVLGQIASDHARAVLDSAAAASLSSAEIMQLLSEGAARTAAQVELFDATLPPHIEWSAIIDGVRATYAEARRARRAAKRSRHAFHTWRRRGKELAIQLELLAQIAPELEELHEQIIVATGELGDTVDLLMARDFVRLHRGVISTDGLEALTDTLESELDEKIRTGRRAGRDAFHKTPRAFARKLARITYRELTHVTPPSDVLIPTRNAALDELQPR